MKHLNKSGWRAAIAFCMALLLGQAAVPVTAQTVDRSPITLSVTGASGSGFGFVVIEALNAIYRESYPGSTVSFIPNSVAGGFQAVGEGKSDIAAFMTPPEIQKGLTGKPPFSQPLKGKVLSVMSILEEGDFTIVAKKEWADKYGIKTMADLARVKPPVRLGTSVRATFYIVEAFEEVLKAYNTDLKKVDTWGGRVYYAASGDLMQGLRDGKLDMVFTAGLQPDTRLQDIAANVPLVWIDTDKAVLEKAAATLMMKTTTMPKQNYKFLDRDVLTLRAPSYSTAGAHVPADTVYKMLKAIDEHMSRVRTIHPHFKNFSVEYMARTNPLMPLHPGAERFYKEKGLLK
jgi:TRAP transporter TAXI family solute receptor